MRFTLAILLLVLAGCGGPTDVSAEAQDPGLGLLEDLIDETDVSVPESASAIAVLLGPRETSWEGIVESRVLRTLVTYNHTNYFLDGGTQRGASVDLARELEKHLNKKSGTSRSDPLEVALIPVRRDQLISLLAEGRGDVAMGNLTVTPSREEMVDFTMPMGSNVKELIVSGPRSPIVTSLEDLAGQEVHVRPSSSFRESLEEVSAALEANGLEPIEIVPASEYLETEDLLEMTNAGLIPLTVADDHIARFWGQVLEDLVVHEDVAVATGNDIAWAVRSSADGLKEVLDEFVKRNRQGTLIGNTIFKRYMENTRYVGNALDTEDRRRFLELSEIFENYSTEYDFEYLMIAAQGYQESRLDQNARSRAGAVGVMQLLPTTAAGKEVGIPDISSADANIHAGTKYLRYLVDRYFSGPEIAKLDRMLFAFGAYNAGPRNMIRARAKAEELGYDPNVWFRNVERAMASQVGREPVRYVRNIFKYYVGYTLAERQGLLREAERKKAQ